MFDNIKWFLYFLVRPKYWWWHKVDKTWTTLLNALLKYPIEISTYNSNLCCFSTEIGRTRHIYIGDIKAGYDFGSTDDTDGRTLRIDRKTTVLLNRKLAQPRKEYEARMEAELTRYILNN